MNVEGYIFPSQYVWQHVYMYSVSCCSETNNVSKLAQISIGFLRFILYTFSHCRSIICGETDECRPFNVMFSF